MNEARFWAKVDKSGSCWLWTASTCEWGYGRFGRDGKLVGAHRLSWELLVGGIPEGLSVLHRCDNPLCVKPDHLFLGTHQENMKDKVAKGRQARCPGARNGRAKLNESDVAKIREVYAEGRMTQTELGAMFGVSHAMVGLIVRRQNWRHV